MDVEVTATVIGMRGAPEPITRQPTEMCRVLEPYTYSRSAAGMLCMVPETAVAAIVCGNLAQRWLFCC
jgi:hypothetical protein